MKVAFILSGLPDGLKCLDMNRQKVAATLNSYGWITRVETTFFSLAVLQTYIEEYKDKDIDDFIFFYTGHGDSSSDDGILTLKLHDGTNVDINSLYREYISKLRAKRKVIILDACYSGNFKNRRFHSNIEYLCSSDFDEESYEDIEELENSYFSYYFCEAILELNGMITLENINDYIKTKIGKQRSKYVSIDSKMIIANNILPELKELYNEKEVFLESVEKIIKIFDKEEIYSLAIKYTSSKHYINKIEDNMTSLSIIEILYDTNQKSVLGCILYELSKVITLNKVLQDLVKKYFSVKNCNKTNKLIPLKNEDNHIFIHFQQDNINDLQYKVSIFARYTNGKGNKTIDDLVLFDITSSTCQNILIGILRELRPNIPIHLILPPELYLENFRLWRKGKRKLMGLLNPIYIHSDMRFNKSLDDYEWMIEDWKNFFIGDEKLSDILCLLKLEKDEYDISNNKMGICFEYQPLDGEDINEHLDIAQIAVWAYNTQENYKEWIALNFAKITIEELPYRLQECEHISLLWDDMSMLLNLKKELDKE